MISRFLHFPIDVARPPTGRLLIEWSCPDCGRAMLLEIASLRLTNRRSALCLLFGPILTVLGVPLIVALVVLAGNVPAVEQWLNGIPQWMPPVMFILMVVAGSVGGFLLMMRPHVDGVHVPFRHRKLAIGHTVHSQKMIRRMRRSLSGRGGFRASR
jgi:hypothetical protein